MQVGNQFGNPKKRQCPLYGNFNIATVTVMHVATKPTTTVTTIPINHLDRAESFPETNVFKSAISLQGVSYSLFVDKNQDV